MACQQAHHQTNSIKRSSSFENPPSGQSKYNVPFVHYALVYIDEEGRLGYINSPSIQEHISAVLTSEVLRNFLIAVGKSTDFQEPVACTSPHRFKRRRGNVPASIADDCLPGDTHSDGFSLRGDNMVSLRIGETQEITEYYESALKHFQQVNCRMIAKAFIKFIEPRKQVRHPYNGGKPSPGSAPGSTGDPEKTKPEWWPPCVMHKQPDHLRKEYRIELLLHIIRNLKDYGVTAEQLKEVAGDTKRSLKHPSHIEIIFEILRVRKVEECYERGDVDGSTLVYVENRGPSPKGDEIEDSADSPAVTDSATGQIGEGFLTPGYLIKQPAASPISINTMGMPTHSILGSLTPMICESLQGCPSYATPTQYISSQSTHSTPVTAEITGTQNFLTSDYQSQNPFSASTSSQQCSGLLSPFDVWSMPSCPGKVFSPVDYSTFPPPQPLPQPSIPYGISMEPSARLHAMRSHDQAPEDPICLSRSFHTSSRVTCTICYPSI